MVLVRKGKFGIRADGSVHDDASVLHRLAID